MAHRDYNERGANVQIDIFDDRVEISNPGGLVSANPLLFSLFKGADLVEKVGSGIGRMRKAMKQAGLPAPKFEFTNFFTVIFRRPLIQQKTTQKILELIKEKPRITRKELAEKIGISEEGIKFNLNQLKKQNKIKRVGPDKGGYWEILK
jgi:ATP-dependent DNA helicase RecG